MNRRIISIVIALVFTTALSSCTYENKTSSPTNVEKQNTPVAVSPQQTPAKETPSSQTPDKPKTEIPKEENKSEQLPPAPLIVAYKQGDKGDKIKEIQQNLNRFGYGLMVDGDFGAATFDAAIDFQQRHKISADGIVGETTLEKLNGNPTPETMYQRQAVPSGGYTGTFEAKDLEAYVNNNNFISKTNYFIWIDLPHQRVNVFSGSKNNWKLVKSMPCSSGKPSTPTVKGSFNVGIKGSYFVADGGAVCKYYTQISGNYLFHSVLYDSNGNSIIDGTLGVPVSHGCVRLAVENAKFIYDTIPAGTAIWSQ